MNRRRNPRKSDHFFAMLLDASRFAGFSNRMPG
jgi:hypothetical protein